MKFLCFLCWLLLFWSKEGFEQTKFGKNLIMCTDKKYLNSICEWRIFNQYSLSHQVNKSYKSVYDKQVNFHEWAHKTIIFSMNIISPIHWYICAAQYMTVSLGCWQNFECFTFLKFENPSRESKVMQFFCTQEVMINPL